MKGNTNTIVEEQP